MEFVCGGIWGVMTSLVMVLTSKFYIPFLYNKRHTDNSVQAPITPKIGWRQGIKYCLIFIFAFLCGYLSYQNANIDIGRIRVIVNGIRAFICFLILACAYVTDHRLLIIPNILPIIMIITRLLCLIPEISVTGSTIIKPFITNTILSIVVVIFLLAMGSITKGGIGMGDIKLFGGITFLCSFRGAISTLLFALLIMSIVSIGLLALHKKKIKDSLPMAPYIWVGYGLSVMIAML